MDSLVAKVKPGVYQHYKGNEYRVLLTCLLEENGQLLVVYQDMSDQNKIWARSVDVFLQHVDSEGKKVPRFVCIRSE